MPEKEYFTQLDTLIKIYLVNTSLTKVNEGNQKAVFETQAENAKREIDILRNENLLFPREYFAQLNKANIHIEFYPTSDSYDELEPDLVGSFIISEDEIIELEENINNNRISDGYLKFNPNTTNNINAEQENILRNRGILVSDIYKITYL